MHAAATTGTNEFRWQRSGSMIEQRSRTSSTFRSTTASLQPGCLQLTRAICLAFRCAGDAVASQGAFTPSRAARQRDPITALLLAHLAPTRTFDEAMITEVGSTDTRHGWAMTGCPLRGHQLPPGNNSGTRNSDQDRRPTNRQTHQPQSADHSEKAAQAGKQTKRSQRHETVNLGSANRTRLLAS